MLCELCNCGEDDSTHNIVYYQLFPWDCSLIWIIICVTDCDSVKKSIWRSVWPRRHPVITTVSEMTAHSKLFVFFSVGVLNSCTAFCVGFEAFFFRWHFLDDNPRDPSLESEYGNRHIKIDAIMIFPVITATLVFLSPGEGTGVRQEGRGDKKNKECTGHMEWDNKSK